MAQNSQWHIKDSTGESGPLNESEMRERLLASEDPTMQVRQGTSDWHSASQVRKKLKELAAQGIYIRYSGTAEGPFTAAKAYELLQTVSPDGVEVKVGRDGKWRSAKRWLAAIEKQLNKAKEESPRSQSSDLVIDETTEPLEAQPVELEAVPVEDPAIKAIPVVEPIPVAQLAEPNPPLASRPISTNELSTSANPALGSPAIRVPPSFTTTPSTMRAGGGEGSSLLWLKILLGVFLVILLLCGIGGFFILPPLLDGIEERKQARQLSSSRKPVSNVSIPFPLTPARGMLFRPELGTSLGTVNAGTAFAARIDGRSETLIMTALHLFGPAGGLGTDIPSERLGTTWQTVGLTDSVTRTSSQTSRITPVVLRGTKPLESNLSGLAFNQIGDVAVCVTNQRQFNPITLSNRAPREGDRVWLFSAVLGKTSLVHPARIVGTENGWLVYEFDGPEIELMATSGAPLIDDRGEVIAVHAGGGSDGGTTTGVGSSVNRFLSLLTRQLRSRRR